MAALKIYYSAGVPHATVTLCVKSEDCEGLWFEELPLFAYLTTAIKATKGTNSTSEAVFWEGQFTRGLEVFFSGNAAASKEESLEVDYWDLVDEDDSLPLNLELLRLEGFSLSD